MKLGEQSLLKKFFKIWAVEIYPAELLLVTAATQGLQ